MNRNAVNSITGFPLGEYTTPTFHIWGRKGGATDYIIGPRNLMESTQEVHDTEWREAEYDKMLHLNNGARLRMGMFCIKYFSYLWNYYLRLFRKYWNGTGAQEIGVKRWRKRKPWFPRAEVVGSTAK